MSELTQSIRLPYTENKKLNVINFFGGPCTYKSTTAAKLYAHLNESNLGYRTELIHEAAKDLKWDNRLHMFGEQDYIFAMQNSYLRRLVYHDITHAIVDSSILLSLFYMSDDFPQSFKMFVTEAFNSYNNINIRMVRPDNAIYHQEGRNETVEEAKILDDTIQKWFVSNNIPVCSVVAGQPDTLDQIVSYIKATTR